MEDEELDALLLSAFFLITPLGVFILALAIIYAPSHSERYIFFFGLTFGVIAYCCIPSRQTDITRYFQMIDSLRRMTFAEAMASNTDGLVIKTLLFWIVSKTGNNQLLPFFSMTTIYATVCYLVVDSTGENKAAIKYRLLFLILMLPFYNVFTNVRNVSAFALLSLALYRDLIKNNRDPGTIVLYIVPCFLHMTGFIVVAFRLILPLIRKFPIAGITSTLLIPTASILVFKRIRSLPVPGKVGLIVNRAIWKAYTATMHNSEYAQAVQEHGSFILGRLIGFLCLSGLLALIILFYQSTKNMHDYMLFEGLVVSIALIWTVMGVVKYWIMMYLAIMLCPPVLSEVLSEQYRREKYHRLLTYMMTLACCMNVPLQIHKILRNFDLALFFERFMFNNYLTIVLRSFCGLLR